MNYFNSFYLHTPPPPPRDTDGLDMFQRRLKYFDIKISGADSDVIDKFFGTVDSAALFPEYVARTVTQGLDECVTLKNIIASKTVINSLDYRTSTTTTGHDVDAKIIAEGGPIPETVIKLKDNLVKLTKRGRMLVASYEAVKFQRIDLFTITLKQIGAYITKAQLADAVNVLINGDAAADANSNKAEIVTTAAAGTLTTTICWRFGRSLRISA